MLPCYMYTNTISFLIVVKHLQRIVESKCLHIQTAGSLPMMFDKTRFETHRKNESEIVWKFGTKMTHKSIYYFTMHPVFIGFSSVQCYTASVHFS